MDIRPLSFALALATAACNGQTPEQKAAADASAVAQVEAAQARKPPIQPIQLGVISPTVRRSMQLYDSGCAFQVDPNPGAFPLLVAGSGKAVMMLNGEPAVFAADSGSPEIVDGLHEKYMGRTLWAQIANNPDRVTIRDRYDRIVFQAAGEIDCRG